MNKELYDWQEECLERWFEHNGRGIVQAVTGSGKTLLALSAMDRLNQKLNDSLRKLHTADVVIAVKTAVNAVVFTVIGNIKRRKQINSVAKMLLCFLMRPYRHLL